MAGTDAYLLLVISSYPTAADRPQFFSSRLIKDFGTNKRSPRGPAGNRTRVQTTSDLNSLQSFHLSVFQIVRLPFIDQPVFPVRGNWFHQIHKALDSLHINLLIS